MSIQFIILFIFLAGGLYYIYKCNEVKYIQSDIDSKKYVVLNKNDARQAANVLANISSRLLQIKKHLVDNHSDKSVTKNIQKRFDPSNISEGSNESQYTSYTIDKGEQMVFCLRDKDTSKLHELNLLMYVSIHELAHVGCDSIGHNEEFQRNFDFLLDIADKIKVYQRMQFGNNNIKYCGLML